MGPSVQTIGSPGLSFRFSVSIRGFGIYHLVLVYNERSVLGTLNSPWGTFNIRGSRDSNSEYISRLSALVEDPIHDLTDDMVLPERYPCRVETVAQTDGRDIAIVSTRPEIEAFLGDTAEITLEITNNSSAVSRVPGMGLGDGRKGSTGRGASMTRTAARCWRGWAAKRPRVGARDYPRIQLWSVEDCFDGRPPDLPPLADPYTGAPLRANMFAS